MKLSVLFKETGEPFVYYPGFVSKLGISVNASVLLCFIAWKTHEHELEERVWKAFTTEEITKRTGLSVKEQGTARSILVAKGLLEEHYARLRHTLEFRLTDFEVGGGGVSPNAERADAEPPKGRMANSLNGVSTNRVELVKRKEEGGFAPSRRFSDGWLAAYKEVFGQAYIYSTKDGVQAARLLKNGVTPDDALAIARAAWVKSDEKKFWACVNQSKEVPKFVAAFNAIRRELAADGLACGVKKPSGLPPRRIVNGNY